MPKKITYEQLVYNNACADYLIEFKKLFGKEVKLTKKIILKHYKDFPVIWAAKLLNPSAQDKYNKKCWLTFYELYEGE